MRTQGEENDIADRLQTIAADLRRETELARMTRQIICTLSDDGLTFHTAVAACLKSVCETHGWDIGHMALIHADAIESAMTDHAWYISEAGRELGIGEHGGFLGGREEQSFIKNIDGTTYMTDLTSDPPFALAGTGSRAGLRSGVIVPVRVDEQVPAYIEFYATDIIEASPSLSELLDCTSALIGQQVQRRLLQRAASDSIWLMQRRVGRELHDSVCQDLVGLAFLSRGLLSTLEHVDARTAGEANELAKGIDTALSRARAISKGLSPIECRADELPRALGDLMESAAGRFDIDFELDCPNQVSLDSDEQARHLFFIAHEAVTNAAKHSQADRINLLLGFEGDALVLRVRDNGAGMVREQDTSSGIGMRVMRYRAETIGARLTVASLRPGGTTLTCTLPRIHAQQTPRDEPHG